MSLDHPPRRAGVRFQRHRDGVGGGVGLAVGQAGAVGCVQAGDGLPLSVGRRSQGLGPAAGAGVEFRRDVLQDQRRVGFAAGLQAQALGRAEQLHQQRQHHQQEQRQGQGLDGKGQVSALVHGSSSPLCSQTRTVPSPVVMV